MEDYDRGRSRSNESSSCWSLGCCGMSLFLVSTIAYCVTMGVGWALSRDVVPENQTALAGAIISTIPVFAAAAYIYMVSKFGGIVGVKEGGFVCVVCIEMCAAVFEFIGGALLLSVGLQAEDDRIKAFGASAAAFGFLSACSCCCGMCCCCIKHSDDC